MNTDVLRAWAEKHDIENKTIDSFWSYINSFEEEENEAFFDTEIDKNQLMLSISSIGLFIGSWNKDSYFQYGIDYITSYLAVIYNEQHLGDYKLFFTLDGEIFDDTFLPV
ncbi:hypothetical protein [Metabacillus fastidiosus]|uniref:hypothetical protein n=1 Tax=Metabacillus fastidiosus TaxID=1458 RepID=UPI003D2D9333